MKIFTVLIEGRIDERTGFFISIEAAARNASDAGRMALQECERTAEGELRIEEVTQNIKYSKVVAPRILKVYGRSYFPIEV